jgi:hypothetical protein
VGPPGYAVYATNENKKTNAMPITLILKRRVEYFGISPADREKLSGAATGWRKKEDRIRGRFKMSSA